MHTSPPLPAAHEIAHRTRITMFLLVLIFLHGADAGFRAVAQAPPDFGGGIARFTQLGLPDVTKARYVKINWSNGGHDMDAFGGGRGDGPKLEGNAWLLEEKPGTSAVVIVNGVKKTEVLHPKVLEQKQREMMEKFQKLAEKGGAELALAEELDDDDDGDPFGQLGAGGEWKDADLAKDAKTLIAWLGKPDDAKQPGNRGLNDPRMFAMQFQGGAPFFFFAAHAYQQGLKAEANELIALLFKRVGDNRKVLGAAMSALADAQYADAYAGFAKAGDWKRYLADMDTLLQRYPGVWRDRPIVERVATNVRKHLALAEPPAITGEGLTAADKKLADDLARDKRPLQQVRQLGYMGAAWLLQPEQVLGGMMGVRFGLQPTGTNAPNATNTPPLARILQRKVQAIPLLVALLKDDYLLRLQPDRSHSSHFSSDEDNGAMTAEEIDQRLDDFPRPVSRGEIAKSLLAGLVLPEEARYDRSQQPAVEELARRGREWYDKHKGRSEKELLRYFLTEGREGEQQMALQMLMRSEDAADLKEVERALLKPEKLAENIQQVAAYAQFRGAKAKPFVVEFLAKVRALPSLLPARAGNVNDPRYRKQMEDQVKQQLKSLEEITSDKTIEAVLKELLAADKKWDLAELNRGFQALWTKLSAEEPEKALTLILQSSLDAKDDTLAAFLLQNAARIPYLKLERGMGAGRVPPKPVKLPLEKYADLWKRLLAQNRQSTGMERAFGGGMAPTHKQGIAMMIEGLHGGADTNPAMMRMGVDLQTLGPLFYDLQLRRAEARLAGKSEAELPAFPDKSKVTDARKAELAKQLAATATADQPKFVASLTLDEVLVLPDLVKADAKLNAHLAPGAHLIREVQVGVTNAALKQLCESFQNKPLDKKILETLVEQTKQLVKDGTAVMVMLQRGRPLGGVQLSVQPMSADMGERFGLHGDDDDDETEASMPAMVMAQVYAMKSGVHGSARWSVDRAKPATASTKKGTDDDLLKSALANRFGGESEKAQLDRFWETFAKLFEPGVSACDPYHCTLSGIVPQPRKK